MDRHSVASKAMAAYRTGRLAVARRIRGVVARLGGVAPLSLGVVQSGQGIVRRLFRALQFGLDVRGVPVDVLLTGQLPEGAHDLVGDLAQYEPVLFLPVEPGEVERFAESHTGPDPQ